MNRRSTAFFRSLFGKGEYKSCTFGIVCFEIDVAAEYSGEEAGDGETESGSLCLFVEFHEALEDGLALVGLDAYAGVSHGEYDFFVGRIEGLPESDSSMRSEFLRIGQ